MPYDIQNAHKYDVSFDPEPSSAFANNTLWTGRSTYRTVGKRTLDILLIVISAPIVLPLLLVLCALVALDGYNPIYSQTRIGRSGRHFRIFKIRTMIPNAEAALKARLASDSDLKAEWDSHQKLKNDFRITGIGRILRKTSLDELPQLWNVLNGSMSLVGPRPMMPEQQNDYSGKGYYRLQPGITGFWQISARNKCHFSDRAVFDDAYDSDVSLRTDLIVLWRTVSVVLRGTGY